MRHTAKRKQKLKEAADEAAAELIARVGLCEWCRRDYSGLVQHEIANGHACRLKARIDPACSLVLCVECHAELHATRKPAQVLMGLAILWHSRPEDYSLTRFLALAAPHAPQRYTQREVDLWTRRLVA